MRVVTTLGMAVVLLLAMSVSSYGDDKGKPPVGVKVQKTATGQATASDVTLTTVGARIPTYPAVAA